MPFRFIRNPISAILGVIRGVSNPFAPLAQPLGSAISGIARTLGRLGATIETSALRARAEQERRLATEARRAAGVATGVLPNRADIPLSTTRLRREYSYSVRIRYFDINTGKPADRRVTVSSDRLLTTEEAEASARDAVSPEYGFTNRQIIEVEVTGIKRAGAAGTL